MIFIFLTAVFENSNYLFDITEWKLCVKMVGILLMCTLF